MQLSLNVSIVPRPAVHFDNRVTFDVLLTFVCRIYRFISAVLIVQVVFLSERGHTDHATDQSI